MVIEKIVFLPHKRDKKQNDFTISNSVNVQFSTIYMDKLQ